MASAFPKEIRVAWEQLCEGFEDRLVLSNAVEVAPNLSPESEERTNETIWKPQPYIMQSYDGRDQTGNFQDATGLTVPCRIGTRKSVPWTMTDTNLRDKMQLDRIITAARQRLASDINMRVNTVIAEQGTLIHTSTTAFSGYDDMAQIDTIMNEQGIMEDGRKAALSSSAYNSGAGNLAARETMNTIVAEAYRKARLGDVAGFETLKLDYGYNLTAAAGVGVTINGANQFHTPLATSTALGEEINYDNRYQDIAITVTSGTVKVGDAFTIAGVNSVHQISKTDTGNLKTFRIVEIVTGAGGTGTVKISPAIVSGQGATDAELQYQNVTATPANGAAVTFLNTATTVVNPFWKMESIELTPGILMPEKAGIEALTYTTPQGIQLIMQRQGQIGTSTGQYRIDTLFGVTNKNPEMNGIALYNQV